jgi:hypothetical protein
MTVNLELLESAAWGSTVNHWIPNTGGILGPFHIKVTAEDSAGDAFELTGDLSYIEILPPLDDSFEAEAGESNIRENQGSSHFAVYAVDGMNNIIETLKTFRLDSGILESGDRYEEVSSAAGGLLTIGADGYVQYDTDVPGENMYFGVGILTDTGTVRPGDDFRFRIGLLHYGEVTATVSPGDFVAVYDKILLERALEYCNNDAGISDWTRWNDGATVTDAVAYGWGCADSIADFNADMEEQRAALTAYYADTNNETLGENPAPADHRGWSPWEETIAPGEESADRWFNYLFGEYVAGTETYDYLTINGTRHNPYIPGLSTWKKFSEENYHDYDTKRTAGVDCSGFIQRCASYAGNRYETADVTSRCIWGGGAPGLIGVNGFASDDYTWPVGNRNLLIPGDVLVLSGNPGHVAMVLRIVYPDGTRIIDFDENGTTENVVVIESTKGPRDQWKVLNSQTWTNLGGGYNPIRLRINN